MSDALFTGERPIVALDINFSAIDARYQEGRLAGQFMLRNSRPGYIAARLALADEGMDTVFFQQADSSSYDRHGLKRFTVVPDINDPQTHEVYDLPPDQRLRPHAIRVRDGIHPDLHRKIPGYNSQRVCDAMQNRRAVQTWLHKQHIGAIGVHGILAPTADKHEMPENLNDAYYVAKPARIGTNRQEQVLRIDDVCQYITGDRPLPAEGIALMQHYEQTPFKVVAEKLRAEETIYNDDDRHNLVLYIYGKHVCAGELQKAGAQGGCWETAELFSAEELSKRLPELCKQDDETNKDDPTITKIARHFSARAASYAISYQLGAGKTDGWRVAEINPRPYTPDLGVGSGRRQAIAEHTVMAGEVWPLQALAASAYDTHPSAFVTLRRS